MATVLKNLSNYDVNEVPDASHMRIGIVVSDWNYEVTGKLLEGAVTTLQKHGVYGENIVIMHVPGAFELTFGAKYLNENVDVQAIIVLGCVIRGETPHFEYICQGVTTGITDMNTITDTPTIFGVLTTNDLQQALDRAGGKHGNKGIEAAITAIKMVDVKEQFEAVFDDDEDEDDDYDDDDYDDDDEFDDEEDDEDEDDEDDEDDDDDNYDNDDNDDNDDAKKKILIVPPKNKK